MYMNQTTLAAHLTSGSTSSASLSLDEARQAYELRRRRLFPSASQQDEWTLYLGYLQGLRVETVNLTAPGAILSHLLDADDLAMWACMVGNNSGLPVAVRSPLPGHYLVAYPWGGVANTTRLPAAYLGLCAPVGIPEDSAAHLQLHLAGGTLH